MAPVYGPNVSVMSHDHDIWILVKTLTSEAYMMVLSIKPYIRWRLSFPEASPDSRHCPPKTGQTDRIWHRANIKLITVNPHVTRLQHLVVTRSHLLVMASSLERLCIFKYQWTIFV